MPVKFKTWQSHFIIKTTKSKKKKLVIIKELSQKIRTCQYNNNSNILQYNYLQ